jgi:hypothetical protein
MEDNEKIIQNIETSSILISCNFATLNFFDLLHTAEIFSEKNLFKFSKYKRLKDIV